MSMELEEMITVSRRATSKLMDLVDRYATLLDNVVAERDTTIRDITELGEFAKTFTGGGAPPLKEREIEPVEETRMYLVCIKGEPDNESFVEANSPEDAYDLWLDKMLLDDLVDHPVRVLVHEVPEPFGLRGVRDWHDPFVKDFDPHDP